MATILRRLEFKQRYPALRRGLFVLASEKRLPKAQREINIGRLLSAALVDIAADDRADAVAPLLCAAVAGLPALTLTRCEILFTPELRLDVVGTLLLLCKNRKICLVWPGAMDGAKLYYATPDEPEYYECDAEPLQDTYIISE